MSSELLVQFMDHYGALKLKKAENKSVIFFTKESHWNGVESNYFSENICVEMNNQNK